MCPTTFIMTHLPASLSHQEVARAWLDGKGFSGEYDFFFFWSFPGKELGQGLGYFIVNFKNVAAGQRFKDDLDGQQIDASGTRLNVVAARKQVIDDLRLHFGDLRQFWWETPPA
mmetsp:Transcript_49321/g.132766  ORF Transcript_49321/g.132766 Transcript_49321/m.132766 type:complete len:114 (+) Transcript_49321:113-454(+)